MKFTCPIVKDSDGELCIEFSDELMETLERFRVFLRKWKLKAVLDKKTEYPRKDCDEDLFVLAQSAAKVQ